MFELLIKIAIVVAGACATVLSLRKKKPVRALACIAASTALFAIIGLINEELRKRQSESAAKRSVAKSAYSGVLAPASTDITNAVTFQVGGVKFVFQPGINFFELFRGETQLAVDNHLSANIVNGRLFVSLRLVGRDGKQVVEILNNEWKVAPPPGTWDRNYNSNCLEVIDAWGSVVLQIELMSNSVHLAGVFHDRNKNVLSLKPSAAGGAFVLQELINLPKKIKYPSDLHFGELAALQSGP